MFYRLYNKISRLGFRGSILVSFLILVLFIFAEIHMIFSKSEHFDETAHFFSGFFMLSKSDYRISTANLVIGQKLAALPAVLMGANPPDEDTLNSFLGSLVLSGNESYPLGMLLLSDQKNKDIKILQAGRMMILLLAVILFVAVFFWSGRIFGATGALFSVIFMSTCPVFMSLCYLVGSDMPATLLLFLSTMFFWRILHKLDIPGVLLFGFSAGLLFASKMNSITLIPICAALFIFRASCGKTLVVSLPLCRKNISGSRNIFVMTSIGLLLSALLAYISIWTAYGFRYSAPPPGASGAGLDWPKQFMRLEAKGRIQNFDPNSGIVHANFAKMPAEADYLLIERDKRVSAIFPILKIDFSGKRATAGSNDGDAGNSFPAILTLGTDPHRAGDFPKPDDKAILYSDDRSLRADLFKILKESKLLPEAFIFDYSGLGALIDSRPAFFWGEVSKEGSYYYFPVSFLAKTSLPFLLALVFSLFIVASRILRFGEKDGSENDEKKGFSAYDLAPIAIAPGLFMAIAVLSGINIGHRHILPIYPFLYVFAGALAHAPILVRTPGFVISIALAFCSFLSACLTHPAHLAYISPLFGGSSNGWKMFADSSIEWGQDLPALKDWLDERDKIHPKDSMPIYLSYFGTASPKNHGVDLRRLPGFIDAIHTDMQASTAFERLEPGIYIVSATMLQPLYHVRTFPDSFIDCSNGWTETEERRLRELEMDASAFYEASARAKKERNSEFLIEWMKSNCKTEASPSKDYALKLWFEKLFEYDLLRFSRLAQYLRERKADATICGSYYVFEIGTGEFSKIFPAQIEKKHISEENPD